MVYSLLTALGVAINEDIASNILSALYMTTDNFRMPGITADTFSVASACMAAHGKRFPFETTGAARVKDVLPSVAQPVSHTVSSSLANSPVSLEPTFGTRKSAPQEHTITTSETQNSDLASVPAPSAAPQPAHQTPEDWLKPKIFKSSETGTQH